MPTSRVKRDLYGKPVCFIDGRKVPIPITRGVSSAPPPMPHVARGEPVGSGEGSGRSPSCDTAGRFPHSISASAETCAAPGPINQTCFAARDDRDTGAVREFNLDACFEMVEKLEGHERIVAVRA